jgi:(p)ppGpp synthase/HD superfamily hydrolase
MSEIIAEARIFAYHYHLGQLDDSRKSYFFSHLEPVAKALEQFTDDEEIIAAGYLHDIIEDTDVTYEQLKEKFGQRIADLVHEVTDEGEKDAYGKYFPRLKTKEGILIKLCDRASNISRMDSWDEKRQAHYLKKTKFWKDGSDKNELL